MRRGRCWAKKAKSHERQLEPAPDLWRLSPRGSGGTETSGMNLCLGRENVPWGSGTEEGSGHVHTWGGEGQQALGKIIKTINSLQKVSVTGNTQ